MSSFTNGGWMFSGFDSSQTEYCCFHSVETGQDIRISAKALRYALDNWDAIYGVDGYAQRLDQEVLGDE